MRGWTFLLGGLIVWTVHFFALYIIASVFLMTPVGRVLGLLVTLACLIAGALLFRQALRDDLPTQTDIWMRTVALSGLRLSAVAIVWQALPVFII